MFFREAVGELVIRDRRARCPRGFGQFRGRPRVRAFRRCRAGDVFGGKHFFRRSLWRGNLGNGKPTSHRTGFSLFDFKHPLIDRGLSSPKVTRLLPTQKMAQLLGIDGIAILRDAGEKSEGIVKHTWNFSTITTGCHGSHAVSSARRAVLDLLLERQVGAQQKEPRLSRNSGACVIGR